MGLSQPPSPFFLPGETLREPFIRRAWNANHLLLQLPLAAHLRRMVTLTHAKSVVNNGCPQTVMWLWRVSRPKSADRGGFPPHFCAVRWDLVCIVRGDRCLAPAKLLIPTRTGSDFIEQTNPGPSRHESLWSGWRVSSSGGTVKSPVVERNDALDLQQLSSLFNSRPSYPTHGNDQDTSIN